MTSHSLAAPTAAAEAGPVHAPVRNLAQLVQAIEWQHRWPVINLREALLQLRILDEGTVQTLHREDPDLFRSRSHELVERLLLTGDELHRALARVAGVVEVEALGFEVERDAFELLPLSRAHAHGVLPLGMAADQLFVASPVPTSADLQRELCSATGHTVSLVWASREAIERRLELQDRVERAAHARGCTGGCIAALALNPAMNKRLI